MMILARWIEHAFDVAGDRLHDTDAPEWDGAAVLTRLCQTVRRCLHFLHVVFGFGNDLAEMRNGFSQCRQRTEIQFVLDHIVPATKSKGPRRLCVSIGVHPPARHSGVEPIAATLTGYIACRCTSPVGR